MDGLSQQSLIESLDVELNRKQVFRAGEGAGASGSFFFFSYDHRFIIKTLTSEEVKLLDMIIKDYVDHIKKMENQSMLARIYGLFTITTTYFVPLKIMVMQNTYQSSCKSDCVLKFDLKGSRIARFQSNVLNENSEQLLSQARSEEEFFKIVKTDKTLKDVNFIALNNSLKKCQQDEERQGIRQSQAQAAQSDFEAEGMIRILESDLKSLSACLEKDTKFL